VGTWKRTLLRIKPDHPAPQRVSIDENQNDQVVRKRGIAERKQKRRPGEIANLEGRVQKMYDGEKLRPNAFTMKEGRNSLLGSSREK